MRCATLYALAACVAAAMASMSLEDVALHEFRMALLNPRQQVAATATNLQIFSGDLGGVKASAITFSGDRDRPFEVDGDTFNDFPTAAIRACDNQFNKCAQAANAKQGNFAVGDCDKQTTQCKSTGQAATKTAFDFPPPVLSSSNADFDFFCDQ
ncbi:hypothetical protein B0T24DRAFT_581427 [Lasiosphaeria ovina]|uniref:Uncharacterized protein n=1 Tax=Lasiosphaeria ovina TaxID=92902 RepID=A0AAE0JZP1_9PEZI|nr:hypothetical protein B0T24DRAFT_581427 [Lasiosphaeria ovina]